jgi:hypothetical protein
MRSWSLIILIMAIRLKGAGVKMIPIQTLRLDQATLEPTKLNLIAPFGSQ